jgi:hypothetical protein
VSLDRAWFEKNWSIMNVVYFLAYLIALWLADGQLRGALSPTFCLLAVPIPLSLALEAIYSGEIGGTFTADRYNTPIAFWAVVITMFSLGCVFLIVGIRGASH